MGSVYFVHGAVCGFAARRLALGRPGDKASAPSRQRRLFGRQGGFIAVYVIAIVALMAGVVIEGTRMAREKAALARQSFERIAATTRSQAGQQLLKARLETHWSQNYLEQPSLLRLAELQQDTLLIDGVTLRVSAEDAELRPDINLFGQDEWTRLLQAYGMPNEEIALAVQGLLRLRQAQPGGKFAAAADFAYSPLLPPAAVDGSAALPPLRDLVAVGHGSKRLHVQFSPLPLYGVLLGAGPEALARWQDIRSARAPRLADAELIFGPEARKLCYEGEPQQLRLRITAGVAGDEREVLVRLEKGKLSVEAP
jgi:hypothetical protein